MTGRKEVGGGGVGDCVAKGVGVGRLVDLYVMVVEYSVYIYIYVRSDIVSYYHTIIYV